MQIEALIEDGQVKLLEAIHLKHDRVNITVIIPDNEIIQSNQARLETKTAIKTEIKTATKDINTMLSNYSDYPIKTKKMMVDIDQILNKPIDDSLIAELTETQQQCFDAFSARHEFKNE